MLAWVRFTWALCLSACLALYAGTSLLHQKPFIVIGRRLGTLGPIGGGGVGIEEDGAFLPRNIRPHEPGFGIAQERVRAQLVGMLHPSLFRLWSGGNARKALLA